MIRPTLASLVGILFVAQTAWAADREADIGRYQVVPDALVPGKGGKPQERTVLLDSATGETWLMSPGAQQGKSSRPIWVPIEVEVPDQANTATWSSGDPKKATVPRSNAAKRPKTKKPLPFQREYDDDP